MCCRSALSTLDCRYKGLCSLLRRCESPLSTYALRCGSKQKWRMAILWIIAPHSLAVAYLRTVIPLRHSTADALGAWEVWGSFSNGHIRRSRTTVLDSSLLINRCCMKFSQLCNTHVMTMKFCNLCYSCIINRHALCI